MILFPMFPLGKLITIPVFIGLFSVDKKLIAGCNIVHHICLIQYEGHAKSSVTNRLP